MTTVNTIICEKHVETGSRHSLIVINNTLTKVKTSACCIGLCIFFNLIVKNLVAVVGKINGSHSIGER
jgi:hypothetical protein